MSKVKVHPSGRVGSKRVDSNDSMKRARRNQTDRRKEGSKEGDVRKEALRWRSKMEKLCSCLPPRDTCIKDGSRLRDDSYARMFPLEGPFGGLWLHAAQPHGGSKKPVISKTGG